MRPGAPRRARTPTRLLYRIGRPPDPLAWPPFDVIGQERFDDPLGQYRVLYAAIQRAACFAETLAPFRLSLATLAATRTVTGAAGSPWDRAMVPRAWWQNRLVGSFHLSPGRWLDLRVLETFQALRVELAPLADRLALVDLDLGAVSGPGRALTQTISRWAYEHGYQGIAYKSRHDHRYDCWAVFEGTALRAELPQPITSADRDFRAIARRFGLAIER